MEGTKKIPVKLYGLRASTYALVDAEDFALLSRYYWWAGTDGYAVASINGRVTSMHRLVMSEPHGLEVSHLNRKKLDNRKANLSPCTHQQNLWNNAVQKNCTTGIKGVGYRAHCNRYRVRFTKDGKRYYFGQFKSLEKAKQVARDAQKRLYGEHCFVE